MISLISIRAKYIIRNPLLLFLMYLLIPILIMIATAIYLVDIDHRTLILKNDPQEVGSELDFASDSYDDLKNYWNNTIFMLDNEDDCYKINDFLRTKINREVACSSNHDKLVYYSNIIKIDKLDNNKYTINLDIRNPNTANFSFFDSMDESKIKERLLISNESSSKNFDNYKIFFSLQSLLSKLLIELSPKNNNKQIDFKMYLGYNSYPDHYKYEDRSGLISFVTLIIALQFSLNGFNFNMRMIDEKENKLNILLERQGISKFKYNFSWFLTFFTLFSLTIVSFIFFFFAFLQTHFLLVLISLVLLCLSIFSVCVFFNTCIKTTKTANTALKFFYFGSLVLGFVIVRPDTQKYSKILFCLIPQINIFPAINCIYSLRIFGSLNWDKLWLPSAKMSYFETCIMFFVDFVLYLGISIIIQSYSDSGLSFFQYLKSFFTKVNRDLGQNLIDDNENQKLIQFEIHHEELSESNKQKKEQDQCLRLVNVSKSFGDVKAVNNFNGELFTNEIFCLLGHNGAGKSTTINMISGIYDPDQGDILLDGRSLVTNKKYLYENIGLCQQEDIFFEFLTVEEHLEYMCRIKGSQINKQEINELIDKIELTPKKKALCKSLSGGQKRKLCIALALIGDSKIILLDEPTSGMDVMARRSLWEFLKNYKKNKIILLTTHFLDEAEYLGDRIGIMSDGQFLCSGSSSFLKSKYPCGFNINLIINSSIFNEEYKRELYNGILKYEPKAEIKVASKGILSINIQSNNQNIAQIFNFIEQNKDKGIEDYTVSSTSLEDVFLKINNKANLNDLEYAKKGNNQEDPFQFNIPISRGLLPQLKSHIIRGLYPFYRNKTLFFFELLAGLGFIYIYILFFRNSLDSVLFTKVSFINILKENIVYIYDKDKMLKDSDFYKRFGEFPLEEISNEPTDFKDFMNTMYKISFANIAKGGLYIKKSNSDSKIIYDVYNSEINSSNGYFYANTILFFSALLKEYNIDATIFPEINFKNTLLSSLDEQLVYFATNLLTLFIICLITLFGFVIFLGGLIFEKIKERRTNIKHLLYLSGSNTLSYWLGFLVIDYLKLTIFSILLIIPIYLVTNSATYLGLNMIGINLGSLSFIYFISFFCSKEDDGSKILFIIVFIFILIAGILTTVLNSFLFKNFSLLTTAYIPSLIDLTPITSMAFSYLRIILSKTLYSNLPDNQKKSNSNPGGFSKPVDYLFTSYIAQFLNCVFYGFLLFLQEQGLFQRLIHNIELMLYGNKNNYEFGKLEAPEEFESNNNVQAPLLEEKIIQMADNNNIINTSQNSINQINNPPSLIINNNPSNTKNPLENPYVQKEMAKVNGAKELTTRIVGLQKTFFACCGRGTHVRAINNLYLGLEPNEKFGLLGFNGSGKTTTFRAITNEILTDAGSITLFGYDTKRQFDHIRTMVGYCPQINPLFDYMKVKEIIKFYSELKTCNDNVEDICTKFGLGKYLNTYTVNLSGGNKRKLTFAIAMMNRPSLLLLDEPSTGVDPESRRIMWRNINELSNSGHKYNMILTTHSMEEAEVLCDTVSWLKAGNFITVGNPEELKIQYSAGYKLHIKFDNLLINKGNNLGSDLINETFNKTCSLMDGANQYSNYILSNPGFEPYLRQLNSIVEKINNKTQKIILSLIGKDFSFELILSIIKERQKELFIEILNMKNVDNTIAEMNISMQSLENILTSLN